MSDRLFVFDGMGFAFRAFYAIRNLSNSKGQPTNAVLGFCKILMKLLREEQPSHVVMVFDAPGKTFRDEMYPQYKANRDETPPELISQFPLIDKVVEAFEIPILRVPGVEADDVMGTIGKRAAEAGLETVLVSTDKDLLQLVQDGVTVFDPYRGDGGLWYGPEEVRERFGVPPERVIEVLGLMGDSSDNVPGVRGIGEKTARKLLEKYETIENLYEHLDDLKGKQKEKLEEDHDIAMLSRELVTIKTDVECPLDFEEFRTREPDRDKLAQVFAELEFQSLLKENLPEAAVQESLDYRLIITEKELKAAIKEMRAAKSFAVDTETTSTDPMRAELVGLSMSSKPCTGYYIPLDHSPEALTKEAKAGELALEFYEPIPKKKALDLLKPLLEDPQIGKVGHNIKYDLIVLDRAGISLQGIFMDTMVASYLTDPSRLRHNLGEVSLQYLKRKMIPISDLIGKGSKSITFNDVPLERARDYAAEDADITWRLVDVFVSSLAQRGLKSLFNEVELPLINILARMEMAGISIDLNIFEALRKEIAVQLEILEGEVIESAGETFNINSPKQLQKILFEKLKLTPIRKTKTGYSTDVDVLEQLSREHPLPEKILKFRTLEKLRGTYVEALPKLVNPHTGRIHTSFNQTVAATGRLSSSNPNLQNIPIRTALGRRIRRGFIPGNKKNQLISADYSQIELRVLAHLSGDTQLKKAFQDDLDVHRDTAARVFRVNHDDVTADMRRRAKTVNFGVIYGMSGFGLAKSLNISMKEANRFIDNYFKQYPGVKRWIDTIIDKAKETGYVMTLLNRRRYVPDLKSSDANIRKAAQRIAVNTPVQGTAADVIKIAMIRLDKALKKTNAKLLLQVHDELLVESPQEESEEVAAMMKDIMEGAVALDVPLKVDVGIGSNWDEIH